MTIPLREPRTPPAVKRFAHDNALTLVWMTAINLVGWTLTILTCH